MEKLSSNETTSRAEQIRRAMALIESNPELSKLKVVKEMVENDFVTPAGETVDPEEYLAKVAELHANSETVSVEEVLSAAERNAAEAHWDPRREAAENRPN